MISINNASLFNHKKKNGLPLQKKKKKKVTAEDKSQCFHFWQRPKATQNESYTKLLDNELFLSFLTICSTTSSINVFHFHWENMSCVFIFITVCIIIILSIYAKYWMLITYNVSFDQAGHQWLTAHDQILAWLQHSSLAVISCRPSRC